MHGQIESGVEKPVCFAQAGGELQAVRWTHCMRQGLTHKSDCCKWQRGPAGWAAWGNLAGIGVHHLAQLQLAATEGQAA